MTDQTKHGAQPAVGHLVGWRILAGTALALMILTWITVVAAGIHLGEFNIWLALSIATIKAALVSMFFMHLRWDRPFNALVFVTSLLFLLLFLGFAITDSDAYKREIDWKPADFYLKE